MLPHAVATPHIDAMKRVVSAGAPQPKPHKEAAECM